MKKFFNESGQTLVFVALGMTVMLGFVGFATDVGVLLHEKREVQTAADSAAIAGALELLHEGGGTAINSNITTAAQNDAKLNGFTDGSNGATVTVVMTPNITVSTFNKAGYVQATVTQNTPDFFMKLFGISSMNVSATAIATEIGYVPGCLNIPNDYNAVPAVYLSGNSLIAGGTCGIAISGPGQFNGGKATIDAGSVTASGGFSGNAGVNINAPYSTAPYTGDPYAARLQDNNLLTQATCATTPNCYYDYGWNSTTGQYQPGVTGTATLNGSTLPTTGCSQGTGCLPSGIYYYDIPVSISGSINSATGGVMFYLAGDIPFDFNANGTVNLSYYDNTPTDPYYQVLIDAPNDGPQTTCATGNGNNGGVPGELYFDFGSSTSNLTGTVYAPGAQMFVQDSGASLTFNSDLVLGNLCMQSATFTINGNPAGPVTTKVGLVY